MGILERVATRAVTPGRLRDHERLPYVVICLPTVHEVQRSTLSRYISRASSLGLELAMADNEQIASQASSSSLFSSVFGFVHREIESFVATATGGDPPKVRKVDLIICS